ncbi:hypothetical protein BJQ97_01924 [Geobacillus sp. TFV-3]|uniref:Uncharacterized protein n=1 Tax=Anoxybacteroides amylolyticum TaxID=294699 RepID=A0A160F740_9BACL|nr:hypothetical protein GFC30_3007 [Anoxybacillus amylolyticus]KAF0995263.1 hypothetical protein BJQ97_01924 [Geobacillus sp. TFV-3]
MPRGAVFSRHQWGNILFRCAVNEPPRGYVLFSCAGDRAHQKNRCSTRTCCTRKQAAPRSSSVSPPVAREHGTHQASADLLLNERNIRLTNARHSSARCLRRLTPDRCSRRNEDVQVSSVDRLSKRAARRHLLFNYTDQKSLRVMLYVLGVLLYSFP